METFYKFIKRYPERKSWKIRGKITVSSFEEIIRVLPKEKQKEIPDLHSYENCEKKTNLKNT